MTSQTKFGISNWMKNRNVPAFLSLRISLAASLAWLQLIPSAAAASLTIPLSATFSYESPGQSLQLETRNQKLETVSATHLHDPANRLLEDDEFFYVYDANGNLTTKTRKLDNAQTRYAYDVENQLIRVEGVGSRVDYRYDGLGRRIEKTVQGLSPEGTVPLVSRYVYDQEDLLLEFTASSLEPSASSLSARWLHGPGIDEPLLMERDLNSNGTFETTERFFYHADGLGSIVALTDTTGTVVESYLYDSFGTPTILGPGPDGLMDTADDVTLTCSAFGNPYLFTGREYDCESGLHHYRTRTLDSFAGRFLQEDPIHFAGGDVNLYLYAKNRPITAVDPSGLLIAQVVGGVKYSPKVRQCHKIESAA